MRIVILGGGFGGAYCAQALERALGAAEAGVVLLDRNNYFVFHPLLVEAGTGSLEPRHAVVSIRSFLRRTAFRMTEVTGVDTQAKAVICASPGGGDAEKIPYDHLVIALGSITRLPDVPGLAEHGWEMKSLSDAVALRDQVIRMLELADASSDPARRAALLHFVVVGANFTGVEVAGELLVLLDEARRFYRGIRPGDTRVTLVELAGGILTALDSDLAGYAAERLRRRGMEIRLKSSVAAIEPERAILTDGTALPTRTVVWCAGIRPNPLLAAMPFPKSPQGYLLADPDLRVQGHPDVWAIGDCAVIPDPEGRPYPPTAQHAVREGAHLARNLARVAAGSPTRPFAYRTLGTLVPLGCRTAVAKVLGVKLSGFPAYFLWRTYYWLRMPGWSRKFRVALDWTADLIFRRDLVQLGVHRPPGQKRGATP